MSKKFKCVFTRTTAVLFAALLLGTSAYVPQAVQFVPTGIVANAATVTVVTTEDELETAFGAGGQVQLGGSINLSGNPIYVKQDTTLDLNGYTLTLGWSNLVVNQDKTLTVTDNSGGGAGTILQTKNTAMFLTNTNATLNILKGNFKSYDWGEPGLVTRYSDKEVNISGGNFTINNLNKFFAIGSNSTSTNDTLHITGGTFNEDISAYLANGYKVTQEGEKYVVVSSYKNHGTYWGLKADGTLEIFGLLPDTIPIMDNSPFYSRRNDIKKIVALSGAKAGTSLEYVFYGLNNVTSIDLSELDTRSVTNMRGTFMNCFDVETIDVSTWKTSNVTKMDELFYDCQKLKSVDVSSWDTSAVTTMGYLFDSCKALETLDVSRWDTGNVTGFTQAFANMYSLKTLDIGDWDFANVSKSNDTNSMFSADKALESIRLPGLISTNSFIAYNFSFYSHDSLKQITFTSDYDLTTGAFIPNSSSDRFVQGWFNEDGELVSGTDNYAVLKGEAGTLRRAKSNISTDTITGADDQLYTGAAVEPEITVTDGTETLVKDTDYNVEYADNIDIGTATVTVTGIGDCVGEQEVEFDIAASLTAPADANVVVYKSKTAVADKIDEKDAVKEGYYIISDKQLTFDDNQIDVREYKPNASNHPFKNKDNWSKYCYYVLGLSDNVVASHSHIYKVQTAQNKLNVLCEGEPGGYRTIAELTIAEGNYEYGDKVDIEAKTYAVPEYDVADTDVTFGSIYFKNKANTSTSTTSMPTELGEYSAEIGATFSKDATRYSLYKEFEIGKKDIAKLVKESDPTAEKNDHIEVSLKPSEGETVPGYTVTYNGKQYTPVIKLVNYVYDYSDNVYKETTLVEGTDYTAVITPQTNAGHYTVTINAKDDSVNYKGTGSFDWDITKAENPIEITGKTVVYDGEALDTNLLDGSTDFNISNSMLSEPNTEVTFEPMKVPVIDGLNILTTLTNWNSGYLINEGTYTAPMMTNESATRKYLVNVYYDGGNDKNHNNNQYTFNADGSLTYTTDSGETVTRPLPEGKVWYWRTNKGCDNNIELKDAEYVMSDLTSAGLQRVKFTITSPNYVNKTVIATSVITRRQATITPVADQKTTYGTLAGNISWNIETKGNEDKDTGFVGTKEQAAELYGNILTIKGYNYDAAQNNNAGQYDYQFAAPLSGTEANSGNYKLVIDTTNKFTVEKKALTKDMFTVNPTELTYNGSEQTVNVTASDDIILQTDLYEVTIDPLVIHLIKNTDWEIVDNSNKATNAGTYTVTVRATDNGNYSGELTLDNEDQVWTIKGKDINTVNPDDPDSSMTVEAPEKTYTGSDITETVTVKDGAKTLTMGTDYEIITVPADNKYTDAQSLTQKNAGTYTFYVVGKGNYSGERKATWNINPAEIESVKLTGGTKIYDGKPVEDKDFRVTIKGLLGEDKAKDLTKTFVFKSDDISVDEPTNAGTYTAELTVSDPKGNYATKTVTSTFEIKPREVEVYPAEGQTFEYGVTIADIEDAINTPANIELETAEEDSITGIIAADNTADTMTQMFSGKPFTIAGDGDGKVNVGYYDIVTKDDMDVVGNYKLVYEYPVQVEVTKATLKNEWFTLYVRDEDTNEDSAVETSEVTFNGKKIIVKANNGQQLVEGTDYTVNGTTEVYLPGEYTIDIKGKGNYTGTVTKTYKVDPNKDVKAETVVTAEYTYDGKSPEVSVTELNGSAPLPELSKVTYKYWQKNEQNEWVALSAAPVDAGDYKVQGEVTAKGYEIEVDAAEFTIERKKINITVDPKDLSGTYGQDSYTVEYTYADDAIIDKDKATVAITGNIVVKLVGDGGAGTYELDYSGVTINSDNYELVFPDGLTFVLSKKELDDDNIVFDNANVALHDIGTSTASFKVVVDGKELVKGTDYDVAGTTEADEAGSYTVQIIGKGNYVGFAEKAWKLADDPAAREAAQAVIAQNVTVALDDNMSAKLSGGKKRITATVNATANDGYNITKTGFVYIPAASYVEGQLVIGGEGVTNAGRNNAASYTYGMIDNAGTGIYVRGYAVVNNGAYETVVYTDAQKLVYDDLVRYTATVVGGTITGTDDTTVSYTGTEVKTNKPIVRVTAADAAEDQQFYCWEKNGVVVSYNETFSFYMSEKDTTVTAVYVDADEEIEKQAATYMDSITPKTDVSKIVFVTMSSVPDDCTILTSGLIFTLEEADANTLNSTNYADGVRGKASTAHNYKYTWTKKYTEGETYYIRSYVKYQTADNEIKEVYGDVYKADINGFEIV